MSLIRYIYFCSAAHSAFDIQCFCGAYSACYFKNLQYLLKPGRDVL